MKKKLYYTLACTVMSTAFLTACGTEDGTSDNVKEKAETKTVTDQLDRKVEISSEVSRVVTGSILPFYSTWFVATNSTKELVGMHPESASAARNSVLASISPEVLNASTDFLQNGEVNIEELLKLEPDVYFESSADQTTLDKLTEAGIPTVAIKARDAAEAEPLATFNSWLEVLRQISSTDERVNMFLEKGKTVQAELDVKLKQLTENDKPRVMFLFRHTDNSITVAGSNFFSSQWLAATGAINVAAEIDGTKEVNMEQIYQWDPDIIYITNFTSTQPEDLKENKVTGQDWTQLTAVQEGKVYEIPLGIYRWFPPSGDAPLMLKWLAQNNHPDLFTYDMKEEIKQYYQEFYNYTLTDEEVEKILHPSSDAAIQ